MTGIKKTNAINYSIILFGIFLLVLINYLSGGSGGVCNFKGFYGPLYETIGIYPPNISVGFELDTFVLRWSYGCTTHRAGIEFVLMAVAFVVFGVFRVYTDK